MSVQCSQGLISLGGLCTITLGQINLTPAATCIRSPTEDLNALFIDIYCLKLITFSKLCLYCTGNQYLRDIFIALSCLGQTDHRNYVHTMLFRA